MADIEHTDYAWYKHRSPEEVFPQHFGEGDDGFEESDGARQLTEEEAAVAYELRKKFVLKEVDHRIEDLLEFVRGENISLDVAFKLKEAAIRLTNYS